jgi:integrase
MAYTRKAKRADGTTFYRAVWHTTASTGERSQHSKSFDRMADAKAYANRMEQEVERRGIADPESHDTATFFRRWINHLIARAELSPETIDGYRLHLDNLARFIGHVPLAKLGPHHLDEAYGTLLERGGKSRKREGGEARLSGRTVLHIHRVAHNCLEQARKWKLIAENPARDAKPPKPGKSNVRAMTDDEATRVMAAAMAAEAKGKLYPGIDAVVMLLQSTGIRRSELLGLKWSAVDLVGGTIKIERAVINDLDGNPIIRETAKTKTSLRTINIPATVVERLRRHKLFIAEQRLAWGRDYRTDLDLVFPVAGGGIMAPMQMTTRLRQILRQAKVKGIQPTHGHRHTMATALIMNEGKDIKTVQNRLGHSTPAITMALYTHVSDEHDRAASDAMDERLKRLMTP